MAILWVLMAAAMFSMVLLPVLMRRRARIQQVAPGHPDAADPANYGFVRQEELDVRMPGPDQDLLDVLDVVQHTQDYHAAAQLLAGTEAEGETRWQRVQAFAGSASLELQTRPGGVSEIPGGQWLRVWRTEAPKDAGGAAVQRSSWCSRPGARRRRARRSSGSSWRRRSRPAPRRHCAPGDPVPYIIELSVARASAPRPEFEQLWLKVLDRAPPTWGAPGALHYWCEKWHGSRELAYSFAEAAARVPAGLAPGRDALFAVFEHLPEVNWSAASTGARS